MMFSVIIPLYNKEKFIFETLSSVSNQTFSDYEVIIVNDSSTDNSLNIAKSFEEKDKRFKVYTVPNGGVSKARNFGISKAIGDYVCFLDADDIWKNNYLEEAAYLIKKYGEKDFLCFSYSWFADNPNNVTRHCSLVNHFTDTDKLVDFFKYSVLQKSSVALTSAVIIKTSRLLSLEYWFHENYSMGEDLDLWVRGAANDKIIYSNKELMLYRSFAQGGLMSSNYHDISKECPYWKWYDIKCYSDFKNQFVTRMIYGLARRNGLKGGKTMRNVLKHSRGTYLILQRTLLLIISYFVK